MLLKRLLLVLSAVISLNTAADAAPPKYRIALIIPLTGPVASLGEYVRNGATYAYENLDPALRERIELIVSDDQFDPKQTLSIYNQLSTQAPVDAVFVLGSSPAIALAPITERKKQILMAIGASDPTIVEGRRYAFIHWVIPSVLGAHLADELIRRDFRRVAFIAGEASGTIADTTATSHELAKRGFGDRVVFSESYEKGLTDYRTVISTLKSKQADAVVLAMFPGALSAFVKQAKQLELRAEIIGMETFEDEAEVKASDGTMQGLWYVNASDPTGDFAEKYRGRWGTHPGWGSGNAFDAMALVGRAIAAGKSDADSVREYLRSVTIYKGASGTYSASGDNRFNLPASLKRIVGEKFVVIENSGTP